MKIRYTPRVIRDIETNNKNDRSKTYSHYVNYHDMVQHRITGSEMRWDLKIAMLDPSYREHVERNVLPCRSERKEKVKEFVRIVNGKAKVKKRA